jgi:hypothetical protein
MTRMPVFRSAGPTADAFSPWPLFLPLAGTLGRLLRTDLASVTVTSKGDGLADERRMPAGTSRAECRHLRACPARQEPVMGNVFAPERGRAVGSSDEPALRCTNHHIHGLPSP